MLMRQNLNAKTTQYILCRLLLILACLAVSLPARANTLRLEQLFDLPCSQYGVSKVLALAIARQESGISSWVLNISGRDIRPESKDEAVKLARAALRSGRSFDVGIMQINVYWIKKYGWPVEKVLDPANNVKIGVWILAQEIQRHGLNWRAVASYHTPLHKNPERGLAYARAVAGHVRHILKQSTH